MYFSLILSLTLSVTAATYCDTLEQLFQPSLSDEAEIYLPSWANWTTDLQQRWSSSWYAPSYIGAIKVATVQDIQTTIKIANAHDIPFFATAAGHGTSETLAEVQNGINIDLSNFRYANYDNETETVAVGGSTTFEQVWDALQPAGKELPTGSAQCVGSMGATLGAGIGPLQGHRGLMLDSLVSVNLVTANGSYVTASKDENPELFWGMKGAGFNFGIVTEATFSTFDATYGGRVMEADFAFPGAKNGSFWEIFGSFDDKLDPKLSLIAAVSYSNETNSTVIVLNTIYYGPNETFAGYLKPFLDLGPVKSKWNDIEWNKLYSVLFFGTDGSSCQKNLHLSAAGQGLKQTDPAAYVKFTNDLDALSKKYPNVSTSFVASRFASDAPLSYPDDSAAYAYRDIKTHLLYENIYPDEPALDDAVDQFVVKARDTFQPTSGYANLTMYNNYNHGDEGPEVWFSQGKLERLSALKKAWDPTEKFSYYLPIPLNYH